MDEHELRGMIRESIARQIGGKTAGARSTPTLVEFRAHASHALLPLARGGDDDEGLCLIEPTVRCNHCGYCVSLGH